jgi:H+/gluconate symporter-like permease
VSTYDLAIIPVSVTLGYLIPSLLTIFPAPFDVASPGHQYLVAFWQAFPLWTLIVQWVSKLLCSLILGQDSTKKSSEAAASRTYLKYAGRVYTFALIFCVATHLPSIMLSLLPPDVIPDSIPWLPYLARASFTSTFIPPLPLCQPISDVAEGAHIFLLWDIYIGTASGILWAIALYQNVSTGKESTTSNISLFFKAIIWTILGGPAAAWTILMWERDEVVKQKAKL